MKINKRFKQNIALFFTSQECNLFLTKGLKNFVLEDLMKCVVERMGLSKNKETNVPEILENSWLVMREILFERLFNDFCNCKGIG